MKALYGKKILVLAALATILLAQGAEAAALKSKRIRNADTPGTTKVVTIDIPQSELQKCPPCNNEMQAEESSYSGYSMQLLLSSWSPRNFQLDSYFPNTTRFQSKGLPAVELAGLTELTSVGSAGSLALKTGLGLLTMEREGSLKVGTTLQKSQQNLYLFPLQLGVEFTPYLDLPAGITPYIGAALMPTIAMAQSSALSDSVLSVGLPVQLSTGITLMPGFLEDTARALAASSARLNAGLAVTAGTLSGYSLFGLGLHAGLQLTM